MNSFVFSYPTKVYFGNGAAKQALGAELGAYKKNMLAYGVASAKANGWEQDEMQNTITRNGAIIAYRLMTVGLFVVMLVDIIAFGKNVSEFAILWFVCMVFEGVYRTIATYRAAKDDEENPPSKSALAGDIVKRIFIPVVIFADLIWKFWR